MIVDDGNINDDINICSSLASKPGNSRWDSTDVACTEYHRPIYENKHMSYVSSSSVQVSFTNANSKHTFHSNSMLDKPVLYHQINQSINLLDPLAHKPVNATAYVLVVTERHEYHAISAITVDHMIINPPVCISLESNKYVMIHPATAIPTAIRPISIPSYHIMPYQYVHNESMD
jgi:hypothetical protein